MSDSGANSDSLNASAPLRTRTRQRRRRAQRVEEMSESDSTSSSDSSSSSESESESEDSRDSMVIDDADMGGLLPSDAEMDLDASGALPDTASAWRRDSGLASDEDTDDESGGFNVRGMGEEDFLGADVEELTERLLAEADEAERDRVFQEFFLDDVSDSIVTHIKFFNIRLYGNLSRNLYSYFQFQFQEKLRLESLYRLHAEMAQLAGITEVVLDCCVNSCICYSGDELSKLDACPECAEPRRNAQGRARQTFRYIPITPRLKAMYKDPALAEHLRYRSKYEHEDGKWADVFDGKNYRDLCKRWVHLEKENLGHKFFSDPRDVAFGLMTDGFRIFKRQRGGSATCWPIILINFNLPPEIRCHIANILPLAIIPGPRAPKNFNSFFRPMIDECKQLARGVEAFDGTNQFTLRAYPLSMMGDMPAIKHCSCMKGPNGVHPCRSCEIGGVRDVSKRTSPYYVPLRQPTVPGTEDMEWPADRLPMRTEVKTAAQIAKIEDRNLTSAQRESARKSSGINERCALTEIPSFDLLRSFPLEWLHLMLENHAKNLVSLWQGKFKGMEDLGAGEFRILDSAWEVIGKDTEAAGSTIPAAFGRRTPNIAGEKYNFTGEDWSFWFVHLAPYLLKGRFPNDQYYNHFLIFNRILRRTLQYTINQEELDELQEWVIEYVETYEEIYYQYRVDRLPLVPLTLHAILHIPDEIKMNGPMCYTWSWVMERWCGLLGPAIKSRSKPYACLALRQLHLAQLNNIRLRYGLHDELRLSPYRDEKLPTEQEVLYPEYPASILRFPRVPNFTLTAEMINRLSKYLSEVLARRVSVVKEVLSEAKVTKWGKVRVIGGDKLRCAWAEEGKETIRTASYIRYTLLGDTAPDEDGEPSAANPVCCYGRLEYIMDFTLRKSKRLGLPAKKRFLLAGVSGLNTRGKDARFESVTYPKNEAFLQTRFIDLNSVNAVIGRVPITHAVGSLWGIVDRSESFAHTVFQDPELEFAAGDSDDEGGNM